MKKLITLKETQSDRGKVAALTEIERALNRLHLTSQQTAEAVQNLQNKDCSCPPGPAGSAGPMGPAGPPGADGISGDGNIDGGHSDSVYGGTPLIDGGGS